MIRSRLFVVLAALAIAGAAAFSASAPVSAQAAPATIAVTPSTVAPGGLISYTITAACTIGQSGSVFQWSITNAVGGSVVQGPAIIPGTSFTSGTLTSPGFAAPTTPGTYVVGIIGIGNCIDQDPGANFVVQAPATTAPATTAAPTTAAPTTVAPTTTAAAAVPPAPTTVAPTAVAPTTAAPATAPALPATGQELNLAVVAVLLCLGGGGLVLATRRR